MGFSIRTKKPGKGNKHYIRKSSGGWNSCVKGYPTDKNCDVLANCVGYANGRFNEIYAAIKGYKGNKYNTLNCNAENFIERAKAAGLKVGQTPKAGAIMVWKKGKTLSDGDGAGHVAVVEKVYSNTSVYTSESGYGSSAFWNSKRKKGSNGRWGMASGYTFRGFIYNPAVKDSSKSKVTTTKTTKKASSSNKYTVQKGDTLSSIAKKYNTTWQKIYAANKFVIGNNPNLIKVGQKLTIK